MPQQGYYGENYDPEYTPEYDPELMKEYGLDGGQPYNPESPRPSNHNPWAPVTEQYRTATPPPQAQPFEAPQAPSSQTRQKTSPREDWMAFVNERGYTGAQGRTNLPQWVQEFNNTYGYNWQAGNPNASGRYDSINIGNEWIDSINGTTNDWHWMVEGNGGGGAPAAVAAPAVDPVAAARREELFNLLMGQARQSQSIDRNDPIIRAQADAYSANQERARRNYLGDLAERSSPYATGMMQGQERMTAEKLGQATGAFEAELMGRELNTRREQIMQALQLAGSLLSDGDRLALQKELALIDDATRRYQIDTGNDQFMADLGLQAEDRSSYWDWVRSGGF